MPRSKCCRTSAARRLRRRQPAAEHDVPQAVGGPTTVLPVHGVPVAELLGQLAAVRPGCGQSKKSHSASAGGRAAGGRTGDRAQRKTVLRTPIPCRSLDLGPKLPSTVEVCFESHRSTSGEAHSGSFVHADEYRQPKALPAMPKTRLRPIQTSRACPSGRHSCTREPVTPWFMVTFPPELGPAGMRELAFWEGGYGYEEATHCGTGHWSAAPGGG
jgi:hypothetical protein